MAGTHVPPVQVLNRTRAVLEDAVQSAQASLATISTQVEDAVQNVGDDKKCIKSIQWGNLGRNLILMRGF